LAITLPCKFNVTNNQDGLYERSEQIERVALSFGWRRSSADSAGTAAASELLAVGELENLPERSG